MNGPERVASWRPKAAAHSPMKSRASSMQTLSENAAWNGRCQLSWNSLRPRLVPQPELTRQTKSAAKKAPMSSMRWSLRPSTIASITARVSAVLERSVSRVSAACAGRASVLDC